MQVKISNFFFFIFLGSILPSQAFAQAIEKNSAYVFVHISFLVVFGLLFFSSLVGLTLVLIKTKKELALAQKKSESLQTEIPLSNRNEELSMILRRLSHDFKEFLVNIEELSHISLLESENSPVNEYLHMQLEVLGKMKLLIFRVMEIERIREHTPKNAPILLIDYLRNIIRSMRRIDGGRNIDILLDIPSDLTLSSDADMLEIVFDNLIKNTIEHNHPPDKPLRMNIIGREFSQTVQISVADNGRGIPEELREKIFGLFISNLNKKLGFGLGLYKTKLALEKIQGHIQLLPSDKGETIFHIILPK
ncbi:MAG: HAMP domain-containing sensor histidine kinase [Microscillaceae bacterium]|nr:HAMP domain-containing sensor histidine kinase [Microscillaceae bacterium]